MSENTENVEMWATVELMGHAQTAGRISRPSDWGGLLRVDVPVNGDYRTEFYGLAAIYSIKVVSEQIARAYAQPSRSVVAYDTPIVTREMHQAAMRRAEEQSDTLRQRINVLERRLIAVAQDNAVKELPEPECDENPE
jgi:hypothetical protein